MVAFALFAAARVFRKSCEGDIPQSSYITLAIACRSDYPMRDNVVEKRETN
jgi:hypothetical protein